MGKNNGISYLPNSGNFGDVLEKYTTAMEEERARKEAEEKRAFQKNRELSFVRLSAALKNLGIEGVNITFGDENDPHAYWVIGKVSIRLDSENYFVNNYDNYIRFSDSEVLPVLAQWILRGNDLDE